MSNTNKTNRVAITDIEAPESAVTDAEAQNVTGGSLSLLWRSFRVGYTIGTLIDRKFGVSTTVADKVYKWTH